MIRFAMQFSKGRFQDTSADPGYADGKTVGATESGRE
jgi:hypothetical protein